MEKEKLESMIIDYIDGRLTAEEQQVVEQELVSNEGARKLYDELKVVISAMEESTMIQPSARLKQNFEKNLKQEMNGSPGRTVFFNPTFFKVAAAVVLMIVSAGLGFWISENNTRRDNLARIEKEMEAARQELAETKSMMMSMLGNDQSASQRMKGVNVAMELPRADDEIVRALFDALQTDRSTNVRLAALEALARFRQDPAVRKGLVESLSKVSDPMVQIKLIQLMVEMKEKDVVHDLQDIVDDAGTIKAVKDEAYSGILKLS
ncbi:MAG: HEAT repeat domain-containing protein [Bacteroidota bacterium]|nr:HEAT repeat domain-containing protein [Bacteroidota bacterium]